MGLFLIACRYLNKVIQRRASIIGKILIPQTTFSLDLFLVSNLSVRVFTGFSVLNKIPRRKVPNLESN